MPAFWPAPPLGGPQLYPTRAAAILEAFGATPGIEPLARAAYVWVPPAGPPLRHIAPDLYLLDLTGGPTLAFKDYALQLMAPLLDRALERRGETCTLLAATSGDTGSAAIAAFAGHPRARLIVLHPKGRVSEVQRRQMTTVHAPNLVNLAVEGDFDDCQAMVKAAFANAALRRRHRLNGVNSINWARIAAQIAYYLHTAAALARPFAVAVPTGNFGNVFAAYAASRLGAPIQRLIIGSNRNDILTRFFESGDMSRRPVEPSLSPSMDIAVSSNFERLAFELLGRDPAATAATMARFAATGHLTLPEAARREAATLFRAHRVSDAETLASIAHTWRAHAYLIDPHTAVGLAAARAHHEPGLPTVVAATAHPAKFPEAVAQATGQRPTLPEALKGLYQRPETYRTVPPRLDALEAVLAAPAPEFA